MKQFVVIGLGRFGSSIAQALSEKGFDVLAIDENEERIKEMEGIVSQSIVMDATDEKGLKELGITDFDTAIVSMGETIEDSIMITLSLKEMGLRKVIVKAKSESIASPKIFDFIELSKTYGIIEMVVPKRLVNKTLSELKMREKFRVSVIAIKRKLPFTLPDGSTDFKEEIIVGPGGDDEVISGDVLIMLGKNENLEKIEKL